MAIQPTPPANNPPNVNPSPRARFMLESENIRLHKALIEKPELRKGIDTALAEMTKAICAKHSHVELTNEAVTQSAAVAFMLIRGAHEFAETFFHIADPYAVAKPQKPQFEALEETN